MFRDFTVSRTVMTDTGLKAKLLIDEEVVKCKSENGEILESGKLLIKFFAILVK